MLTLMTLAVSVSSLKSVASVHKVSIPLLHEAACRPADAGVHMVRMADVAASPVADEAMQLGAVGSLKRRDPLRFLNMATAHCPPEDIDPRPVIHHTSAPLGVVAQSRFFNESFYT